MKNISTALLNWYFVHKRDMPWRHTKDPYIIWLSEIILQQTRVNQGLSYFLRFIDIFPNVKSLAEANEDKVMKLWQGLGYYSRAKNLHKTAKIVNFELDGSFPASYSGLISLPGIGQYTAAAISSICFGETQPVLDGNVYRVLSRLFNVELEINTSKSRKSFLKLAKTLMGEQPPGDFNQAVMEFGALHCTPKNPPCNSCVLNSQCKAMKNNAVNLRPVIKKKKAVKHRYFNYFFIHDGKHAIIKKRVEKDIWAGLYDFPLLESTKLLDKDQTEFNSLITEIVSFTRQLTHQKLHIRIFVTPIIPLPHIKK